MRLLRIVFFTLMVVFIGAPGAWAHARLIRAEPKSGAEVAKAPRQVELWFNELLEEGFNTVTVFPSTDLGVEKKSNFVKGKPVVDPRDHTHLIIQLAPLHPGEYIIEWRVLSRDGHSAPGRSKFTVRAS